MTHSGPNAPQDGPFVLYQPNEEIPNGIPIVGGDGIALNVVDALKTQALGVGSGSVSFDGNITIIGEGLDFYNESDQGFFVYKQLNGDGEAVCKIESLAEAAPNSKVGLMIRHSLDTDSPMVLVNMSPGKTQAVWRDIAGQPADYHEDLVVSPWLKLVRAGGLVTCFRSDDGTTWIQIDPGSHTGVVEGVSYIGLACNSGVVGTPATAIVSNLNLTNTVPNNLLVVTNTRNVLEAVAVEDGYVEVTAPGDFALEVDTPSLVIFTGTEPQRAVLGNSWGMNDKTFTLKKLSENPVSLDLYYQHGGLEITSIVGKGSSLRIRAAGFSWLVV